MVCLNLILFFFHLIDFLKNAPQLSTNPSTVLINYISQSWLGFDTQEPFFEEKKNLMNFYMLENILLCALCY